MARLVAHGIQIAVQELVGEVAHDEVRCVDMLECHRITAHHRHRRMQRMRLAAQRCKLRLSAGPVRRLGETPSAERECLIGPQNHTIRMFCRHGLGLLAGQ